MLRSTSAAPTGIAFPIDIRNKRVFISIEPHPDNDVSGFFSACLFGRAPTVLTGEIFTLQEDLTFSPSGRAMVK